MADEPNIFIAWSGGRSRNVADKLREWLPIVVPSASPWFSQEDIPAGEPSVQQIHAALQSVKFAVVCVTRDNLDSRHMMFEAGAVANLGSSRVAPYLVDLNHADIPSPLSDFQFMESSKEDTRRLLRSIAQQLEDTPDLDAINKRFNRFWDELESKLDEIRAEDHGEETSTPRSDSEKLDELLDRVRRIESTSVGTDTSMGDYWPGFFPRVDSPWWRRKFIATLESALSELDEGQTEEGQEKVRQAINHIRHGPSSGRVDNEVNEVIEDLEKRLAERMKHRNSTH